jgi:protein gp37
MGKTSQIQWKDATWNVAVGCRKVDADCKYCYMYRESLNGTRYDPMQIRKTKTVFDLPLKLKEPSKIFTSSLTDFFLPEIDGFRNEAWDIIRKCPQHTFQILTKRPDRIPEHLPDFWDEISGRIWLGTSVGSQLGIHRIEELLGVIKYMDTYPKWFVSFEPLHGAVVVPDFLLNFIDWVIIGGESGNENGKYKYRPCELEWIESLVNQFQFSKVFVKQLGTHLSKELKLSDRHGGDINEFPENLRIREFPVFAPACL